MLERRARPHPRRPAGRPPKDGYEKVLELGEYQAEEWRHAQRVILVVVDRPDPKTGQLELFPRHFFLVTSWESSERTGGELQVFETHGAPNGVNYFAFAELAILMTEMTNDPFWRQLIEIFGRTAEIFAGSDHACWTDRTACSYLESNNPNGDRHPSQQQKEGGAPDAPAIVDFGCKTWQSPLPRYPRAVPG